VDPVAAALLASWSFEPGLVVALLLVAIVYLRGFRVLRAQLPARFPGWRRGAFLAGVAALLLALVSPLDVLADLLLQVHMVQHWLLMMVAPPLLWLGAPAVPLLRGLPRGWLRRGVGPFLAWPALRRVLHRVTSPVFAGLAWALTTLVWHWPPAYQAALRSRLWHDLEHASFIAASLLFWHAVIAPWPAQRHGGASGRVILLGLAALFNSVFSAVFTFSTRVFYPVYLEAPRPWGIDALTDQNAAGALIWVATSLPMLVAAVWLIVSLLESPGMRRRAGGRPPVARLRRPRSRSRDALALPVVGRSLRSLTLRRAMQWSLLVLAAVIVADGLLGPQQPSALNLAGVLPWTYWRGLVVIGLLVLGNVFCAVCPFTLPRRLAARLLGRPFVWPAALRGKWLAVALFALYLWSYESFALWDSPWWTAWVVVGYFATCFAVEGLFPRGSFCRHVCPIGQFQFVHAGVSPLEVRVLDVDTCSRCSSHDCLRGKERSPGCPTGLFVPAKEGNLDCTFCLDCVRACPHENIGLVAAAPAAARGRGRSPRPERGSGLDVAALVLLLCFGAFVNAAAMTAPIESWQRAWASRLGATPWFAIVSTGFAVVLLIVPALAAAVCAGLGAGWARSTVPVRQLAARLAPSLVPTGLAMWLAHFGFHLLTGIGTLGPASERVAVSLGLAASAAASAEPSMVMGLGGQALAGAQIVTLGVGLVLSVAVAWRSARELVPTARSAVRLAAPWCVLCAALYAAGVWIVLQPMALRGMVMT